MDKIKIIFRAFFKTLAIFCVIMAGLSIGLSIGVDDIVIRKYFWYTLLFVICATLYEMMYEFIGTEL